MAVGDLSLLGEPVGAGTHGKAAQGSQGPEPPRPLPPVHGSASGLSDAARSIGRWRIRVRPWGTATTPWWAARAATGARLGVLDQVRAELERDGGAR